MEENLEKYFHQGAISSHLIGEIIARKQQNSSIGGHDIFLGQIRTDKVEENVVAAIEYTTYKEMAAEALAQLSLDIKEKFQLIDVVILHSLGTVQKGEICLFVMASAGHRKEAIDGCKECVERIKKEIPIWGKKSLQTKIFNGKLINNT
ncbi:molybdenum cofactor biosynthesis protein MoaE [Rhizosphaericola mali]|uniref:molybdenum cofactor biosynthesis protein MoaE n=1 Tax=Rhizosphaericola mali TaxID=2545455 RepID=UPI001CD9A60B|nr:molybdenum cofactor biosynthesis protein MoaE [Rhizosphaericola mali]